MATSLEPAAKPAAQYVDFDEYIDFQLRKTQTGVKATDILTSLVGAATLVMGYLLLFVVLDQWVIPGGFGPLARTVMVSLVAAASVIWIVWKAVLPYCRKVNSLFAARLIERSEPRLNSSLLNLVDLRRAGREQAGEVVRAMEKRAALTLSHTDVDEAVDRRLLMRISYALLAVVVLFCLYTLFTPKKISPSVWRALWPASSVSVATRTTIISVDPGDVEVLARTQLEVTVDLRGDIPEQVRLLYTTADDRFVDQPLEMRPTDDTRKQFRASITGENGRGILQELTYRIEAGDAHAGPFQVSVNNPPSAKIDSVRLEYPEYMGLEPQTSPEGRIDAWEGTKVTVAATANMPVKSAVILFTDTEDTTQKAEEIRMQVTGDSQLSATWKLEFRSDRSFPHFYRIECRNNKGQTDPAPVLYPLNIRPDLPPEVTLIDPVSDLEMPANGIVPLAVRAVDPDFLLRFVTLKLERNGEELTGQTIFEGLEQSIETTYDLRLQPLDLKVGETLTFWIEARDNKQPLGNRGATQKLQIRIVEPVTEQQAQQQLQQQKEKQAEKLEQARDDRNQSEAKGEQQKEGEQKDPGEKSDKQERERGEQPKNGEQPGDDQKPAEGRNPGDKPQPGQKAEPQPGEKGQQKPGPDGEQPMPGEQPGNGQQKKLSPDGEHDREVLEKLLQRQKEQQQNGGNDDPMPDGSQKPEDKNTQQNGGDQKQKGGNSPQDSPKEGEQKNGDSGKQGEKPDGSKKEGSKDDASTKADEPSQGTGAAEKGTPGGKPADEDTPDPKAQPGEGGKAADPKSKPGENAKKSDKNLNGTETPADDSPDAVKKKATGDEKGEGTPDADPNADPTNAKNKLDRKPGVEPATKPSDKKQGDADNQRPAGANDNPNDAKPADKSKQGDQEDPGAAPKPSDRKDDKDRPAAQRDDQPAGANEKMKGEGRPKGQKSEQPDGGEAGESKQDSEGKAGSNKPGPGDQSQQPGDTDPAAKSEEGQPGGSKQGGKKSDGDKKPGGEGSADSSENNNTEGRPGKGQAKSTKPGDGNDSSPPQGDNLGQKGGQKPGGAVGGGRQQGNNDGEAGSSAPDDSAPTDEANLEFAKQATDLVLKRIQDEMKRGDVDEELLKELGWTEDELKKFTGRLQEQLDRADERETPESIARRRQFEEMLKSLNLHPQSIRRTGENVGKGRTDDIGGRRLAVPAEYRELYEAYTRSLSKQTSGGKPAAPAEGK